MMSNWLFYLNCQELMRGIATLWPPTEVSLLYSTSILKKECHRKRACSNSLKMSDYVLFEKSFPT